MNKDVTGDITGITLPDFEITVTGPDGFSNTQIISAGSSYTWPDLIEGAYTITEGELGENWTVSGIGEYIVSADTDTPATITNLYTSTLVPVGSMTVTKTVSGDVSGITLPVFKITVTGPEGFSETRNFLSGESYTWNNLVPGTYDVTEVKTGLDSAWTVTGEGTLTVTADEIVSKTVTNTYYAGALPPTGEFGQIINFFGLAISGLGIIISKKIK